MISAVEFFSGIGGLNLALARAEVEAKVVASYDWDPSACQVYEANYGKGLVHRSDISRLEASEVARHRAEMWLLSPSCQPYTVLNPEAAGADDPRAASFIHLFSDVLPEIHSNYKTGIPRWLLIENVAGFETSTTRQNLVETLHRLNYKTFEVLLTPLQFGIPNSRLRYYLLASMHQEASLTPFTPPPKPVWLHLPGATEPWKDPRLLYDRADGISASTRDKAARPLFDYLDIDSSSQGSTSSTLDCGNWHPCAVPEKVLARYGRLFDIVKPYENRSCCFTRGYTQMVERTGSVLQMNDQMNTSETFDRFLASEDKDINILAPLKIRYFTPEELLRIFHFNPPPSAQKEGSFQKEFIWPPAISLKTRYKLIGNSVNVEVVRVLLDYLFREDAWPMDITMYSDDKDFTF